MRVQLSKDPLFQVKDSPIKILKQQQIQRKKQLRIKRMNPQVQKYIPSKEIIDPLTNQLKQYKQQTSFKKSVQTSKASQNLKKYIIQQEKNLRCRRQERLDRRQRNLSLYNPTSNRIQSQDTRQNNSSSFGQKSSVSISSSVFSKRQINMHSLQKDDQKHTKQINIPKIQQIFKNQPLQYMLFQNKLLKQRINKMITSIDNNVIKSNNFSIKDGYIKAFNNMASRNISHNSKDKPHTQKMYHSVNTQDNSKFGSLASLGQLLIGKHQSQYVKQQPMYPSTTINQRYQKKSIIKQKSFDQMQMDQSIQKRLAKSQKLRKKLQFQKRNILSNIHSVDQKQANQIAEPSPQELSDISYLLPYILKQRKTQLLKGVKTYERTDGDKKYNLTQASYLLFQLHKASNAKDRKQSQLTGLLKNSFQNRQNILNQKSNFYQNQTPLSDLSPSHQYKLRKVMNKKLSHRLQLSKEQINNFIDYIYEIKNQYHVILNNTILQILKQVREKLLKGKVMKQTDLNQILIGKNQNDLKGYPGQKIISSLMDMMI